MAKLERVTHKIFGDTATATGDNPQIGQFGSAKAGTYIGTTDIETIQALPAYSNGWIDAVTPDNKFPALPEMTGVQKVMSYQTGYLFQEGIAEWDTNATYYTNSYCKYNGSIYYSLTDDNQNNNPSTDKANWKRYDDPFLNKNQITNCILEAPNGVIDVNGLTITLKQGVKVLIPNGLNVDGTLKNIEFTVPQEYSRTISSISSPQLETMLIRYDVGTGGYSVTLYPVSTTYFNENKNTSLTSGIQYVRSENQWYEGQNKVYLIPLGVQKHGTTIYRVRKNNVLSILKYADKSDITSWAFPSTEIKNLTLGASGTNYDIPADGWIQWNGAFSNNSGYFLLSGILLDGVNANAGNPTGHPNRVCIPVSKGESVKVTYANVTTTYQFSFTYTKGEQ